MIHARGLGTIEVTKVEGHATEADVDQGLVKIEDRLGNAEADAAPDLGRRHQSEALMDARRGGLDSVSVVESGGDRGCWAGGAGAGRQSD